MLLIGWAYSAGPSLKDSALGFAAVIGIGAALTYTAGSIASAHTDLHELATTLSISLWVALCCGSKDFSDVDGDRLAGRHTWPVILGYRRAARLLSGLVVVAAGCVVVSALETGADIFPALALGAGSIGLAITALRSTPAAERRNRRRPYRVYMLTQYATNAALLIFAAA
jgi:4-hydroxybenzoate polyprenyltransferase